MIREDYILRMIEQFAQALAQIRRLRHNRKFEEATAVLEEEYMRLFGLDSTSLGTLPESALFARLISGDSTHLIREKALMLVTLFNEMAETYLAQDQTQESRDYYLKALNLLLETMLRFPDLDLPGFVPQVDRLLGPLKDAPLPLRTNAALMHHYERIGAFAKAEDRLFEMIEAEPNNSAFLEFGIGFYQRLQQKNETTLAAGDLPGNEVEASLAELQARRRRFAP